MFLRRCVPLDVLSQVRLFDMSFLEKIKQKNDQTVLKYGMFYFSDITILHSSYCFTVEPGNPMVNLILPYFTDSS